MPIINGGFEDGLTGWIVTSYYVYIEPRANYSDWGFSGPGYIAFLWKSWRYATPSLEQTFVIDCNFLEFEWAGRGSRYELYIDDTLQISKELPDSSFGRNETEIIDVSNFVGSTARIKFYSDDLLLLDNVIAQHPYSISITGLSGTEIYIDGEFVQNITIDHEPVIINLPSEKQYTITLKFNGYPDYVEIINITKCILSYVTAPPLGKIYFTSYPAGAEIFSNGRYAGITPTTIFDSPGTHQYTLRKGGYSNINIENTVVENITIGSFTYLPYADIINGDFDTDLSGWLYGSASNIGVICDEGASGGFSVDNGRMLYHLTDTPLFGAGYIQQTFVTRSNKISYNLEFNARQQYNDVHIQILDKYNNTIIENYYSAYELSSTDAAIEFPTNYIGEPITFRMYTRCYDRDGWGSGEVFIYLDSIKTVPITIIPACIIKRDEGIYSKERYCYIGEGIFKKR